MSLEELKEELDKHNLEKKKCNGTHKVHEEPGGRESLMRCYECGLYFSREMAREYGVVYKVD